MGKLNGAVFAKGMTRLESAFNYNMPERMAAVYHEKLSESFSDGEFNASVEKIMETCHRFPMIADFFEAKKEKSNSGYCVSREEIERIQRSLEAYNAQ